MKMQRAEAPSPLEGEGRGGGPRRLIGAARRLRRNATVSEKKLWRLLRCNALGGLCFRRQQPIGRYIADFFCPSAQLIVELDGSYFHGDPVAAKRDEARTQWLNEAGYRVIRFNNDEVWKDTEGVLETILKAAGGAPPSEPAATPLPDPPPQGGRGQRGAPP